MSTLTLRSAKGSPLTNNEVDANFTALNTDKLEAAAVTYELLDTNNDVGSGGNQVAKGDHTHSYLPLAGGTITGTVIFDTGAKAKFNDDIQISLGSGDEALLSFDATDTVLNLVAGDFYIQDNGTNKFWFDDTTGDFHADGEVFGYSASVGSDPKLKKDIELISDATEKLNLLRGVRFTWKRNDKRDAGLLSTDVKQALPEAVKKVNGLSDDSSFESVNYNAVIGLLVTGFQEQQKLIESLQNQIDDLRKE